MATVVVRGIARLVAEEVDSGRTEVVQLLLGKGAALDEKDEDGRTALMYAILQGRTEVVRLLLDAVVKLRLEKGASLNDRDARGMTLLMHAILHGATEVVRLLLDKGAALDVKSKYGSTALMLASRYGHTEVVRLLLDKGASPYGKDEEGSTALTWAHEKGDAELVKLLLGMGASVDEVPMDSALRALVGADEEQLGRMAAGLLHKRLLEGPEGKVATPKVVLHLVHLAGHARERALKLRSSDPRSADDHQALFGRLQLAAAACVRNDESGEARDKEEDVQKLFLSNDGRNALEHAVQIEAKELLAQPVVQGYMKVAWRENLVDLGWEWVLALLVTCSCCSCSLFSRSWHWCHLLTGC